MKPRIFLPEPISTAGIELLRPTMECVAPWMSNETDLPVNDVGLQGFDAVVVRLFKITRETLENSDRLKVVAKHGVGVDNIDLQAAADHGIPVVYTPQANSNAVAEHTIALLLGLARKIGPASTAVSSGRFSDRSQFQGVELSGKTLGVVGLGRIGSTVARIAAHGLSMRVIGYDPFVSTGDDDPVAERTDDVTQLFGQSDFLTFHVPLTEETRHLVNRDRLAQVKPTCQIINTSRGGIVDEAALVEALNAGNLAGAALDVFDVEPIPADHPLCRAPNILLTPHISSSTQESLDRMAIDAAHGVLDVLAGRTPKFPVP
jgi:D-3-phosphoglycerate dehydrogenase